MSAPFSHYFVFTGHNSYLTGNQLNSDSSDVPIVKALQGGVRVIELDMWPNPSKDNVDILHGGYECCFSLKHFHFFIAHKYICVWKQLHAWEECLRILLSLLLYVQMHHLSFLRKSPSHFTKCFPDLYFFAFERTLTAPVEMIKCLKSIKEYAFCASNYPLVITLEDHLTSDLQAKVATV